jgi:hypothetical protein
MKPVEVTEEYIEISNNVEYLGHLPQWPGDEEAENFDFGLYVEPENVQFEPIDDDWKLHKSFVSDRRLQIFYKRVAQYVRAWDIDQKNKRQLELDFINKKRGWGRVKEAIKKVRK